MSADEFLARVREALAFGFPKAVNDTYSARGDGLARIGWEVERPRSTMLVLGLDSGALPSESRSSPR